MRPPAIAAAATRPLPVLLEAAPAKGLAGAIGAPEELGDATGFEGKGALVAE